MPAVCSYGGFCRLMSRFTVFDVETPNRANDRISAIGIAVIEDNMIVDEFYSLVNPETHFDYFNTQLTGIDEEAVRSSLTFPELWEEIEPAMSSGLLAAHNAVFDLGVLKKCLQHYNIEWKPFARYICTVRTGRQLLPGIGHKLDEMCRYYNIPLNHHLASSDSRACAEILLRYIQSGADISRFIRTYSFR